LVSPFAWNTAAATMRMAALTNGASINAMVLSIVAERTWRRPVCVRSKARVCTIAECR
jgi:hypothetical protein